LLDQNKDINIVSSWYDVS